MSSEEVAELAQAIHNHADVLYETWKKGQEAYNMKRMEDTLELLADPGLTPKLEHLVSTFVRRDKEKRQQYQQLSPPADASAMKRESSPSASRKLPKSILAVVQRFEAQKPGSESISPRERSPAVDTPTKLGNLGVGSAPKNVLWAESIYRQGDRSSPSPVNITSYLDPQIRVQETPPSTDSRTLASPTKGKVRTIPIELPEETSPCESSAENEEASLFRRLHEPAIKEDITKKQFHSSEVNGRSTPPSLVKIVTEEVSSEPAAVVVPSKIYPENKTSPEVSSGNGSRVAFAKERIRQSQENPLTQQRMQMQKRLPSPSGSLAAAIAMQQGKQRFNGGNHDDDGMTNGHQNQRYVRFGPGATVADRVQLFEKYPSHVTSALRSRSPSTSSLHPHQQVITHAIHIQPGAKSPASARHPDPKPENSTNKLVSNGQLLSPVGANVGAPWRRSPGREISPTPNLYSINVSNQTETGAPVIRKPLSTSGNRTSANNKRHVPDLPRFYWPQGKPAPNASNVYQECLAKAEEKLKQLDNCVFFNKFGEVLVSCNIPLYWKKPFWMAMGLSNDGSCSSKVLFPFLRYLCLECADEAARFVKVLQIASDKFPDHSVMNNNVQNVPSNLRLNDSRKAEVKMSSFIPMIQDIIDTHPGLGFLRDAPEFHSRYVTTVIARIFYKVNRSWSGRITAAEIRRSNLLRVIKQLEEESDINSITEYFSYEHFYVIYCKFWELDKDHDLLINKKDLAAHADHALSSKIIDRIFNGTVLRGWDVTSSVRVCSDKMTYSDFVWFLLSEEDKKTPTAIEYWFRCLDLDGDGVISPYELQYFYQEQESRIEGLGIEPLNFSNVYCQIVDMLHCSPTGIKLQDLKKNPHLAANVFNTVFNLDKYLEHEQRDPFAAASVTSADSGEWDSDWDKYAAAEYELLIAEENPSEQMSGENIIEDPITP